METRFDTIIDRKNTGACKWQSMPKDMLEANYIPMTVADMEFPVPQPVTLALQKAVEHSICGYTEVDDMYFSALSGYMKRHHNFDVKRENLICTSGIVPAFGIIIRALTEKGDGIILQPPVYTPFFDAIHLNERCVLENPLINNNGHYEIDFYGLEKLCMNGAKMLMLCSPHNPVGRVWSKDELVRIGNICKKYGVLILCDEIHNDIVYKKDAHTTLATYPEFRDFTITCTAMSKTFNLAGLMLSNIFVFNDELYKRIDYQVSRDGSHCIPYFGRAAAIAAFTQCDEWICDLLSYLDGNFELCKSFIQEHLPKLKCTEAEGTYLLWLNCSALGFSDEDLLSFLYNKAKMPVSSGAMFGQGGSGFVRINIALPREELKKSFIRLKEAVNKENLL